MPARDPRLVRPMLREARMMAGSAFLGCALGGVFIGTDRARWISAGICLIIGAAMLPWRR